MRAHAFEFLKHSNTFCKKLNIPLSITVLKHLICSSRHRAEVREWGVVATQLHQLLLERYDSAVTTSV